MNREQRNRLEELAYDIAREEGLDGAELFNLLEGYTLAFLEGELE